MPLIVKYDEQLYWELQPPSADDDQSNETKPKSKKKRRKHKNKDHFNEPAKQGKWDTDHTHYVTPPKEEYSQQTSNKRRNSIKHETRADHRLKPPRGSLIHESPSSRPSPLIPTPPPPSRAAYHGSIHERLEPLLETPPTPRQVRSLSFEHNRIPDEYFTSPVEPPRWAEQSPPGYPRSPFPSTSTPVMSPRDQTHLNKYPPRRFSYSEDSGPSSYSVRAEDHTPMHTRRLMPPPPSHRASPLKRRWSGTSTDYPPYKKRY